MSTILVSSVDVSLYHVAATQLGDATQWWRIAQLNSLADPDLTWLPHPVTLNLPIASSSMTGGVPITEDTQ